MPKSTQRYDGAVFANKRGNWAGGLSTPHRSPGRVKVGLVKNGFVVSGHHAHVVFGVRMIYAKSTASGAAPNPDGPMSLPPSSVRRVGRGLSKYRHRVRAGAFLDSAAQVKPFPTRFEDDPVSTLTGNESGLFRAQNSRGCRHRFLDIASCRASN